MTRNSYSALNWTNLGSMFHRHKHTASNSGKRKAWKSSWADDRSLDPIFATRFRLRFQLPNFRNYFGRITMTFVQNFRSNLKDYFQICSFLHKLEQEGCCCCCWCRYRSFLKHDLWFDLEPILQNLFCCNATAVKLWQDFRHKMSLHLQIRPVKMIMT